MLDHKVLEEHRRTIGLLKQLNSDLGKFIEGAAKSKPSPELILQELDVTISLLRDIMNTSSDDMALRLASAQITSMGHVADKLRDTINRRKVT